MGDILQFPTKRRIPAAHAPEGTPDLFITGIDYVKGRLVRESYEMRSEWFKEFALGYHIAEEIPRPVLRRIVLEWLTKMGVK